jgi:hypothetical protein
MSLFGLQKKESVLEPLKKPDQIIKPVFNMDKVEPAGYVAITGAINGDLESIDPASPELPSIGQEAEPQVSEPVQAQESDDTQPIA